MNLDSVEENYRFHTGKASDVGRQLALAGIAIVWIFSGGGVSTGAQLQISPDLLRVGLLLVIALAVDLTQYLYGSVAWGAFRRLMETRAAKNGVAESFDAPAWINYPTLGCFWTKVSLIAAAYALLGIALAGRLR
jgi:hypothetical protein